MRISKIVLLFCSVCCVGQAALPYITATLYLLPTFYDCGVYVWSHFPACLLAVCQGLQKTFENSRLLYFI